MTKRRGVVWKNFLILMSFMSVLIMLSTFLIYQNAIAVMKEEICNVNMNQAYQVEHNLIQIIEQTDRLASSLCIRDEVKLFWGMESPERADNGFYSKLYYNLKTQVYSMNDRISSIVLYSPTYRRIMDETLSTPYVLTGKERDKEQNIDWIEELEELEDDRIRTSIQLRAIRDSYPYVMTIVKQTVGTSGWGAAAIDIDLNKIHSIIWPETAQGISIWVLDEEGRVIIREKKNELHADATNFEKLNLFERTSEEISVIREDGEVPITYSQRYCEEYGLYIVSV